MNGGFDQRRYPRTGADVEIKYSSLPDRSADEKAKGLDLNAGGISFETAGKLPENSVIKLELLLKILPKTVHAEGRVIRSWEEEGRFMAAVKFSKIEYNDFILLMDYSLAFYRPEEDEWLSDESQK
jgi:hypothetical protein